MEMQAEQYAHVGITHQVEIVLAFLVVKDINVQVVVHVKEKFALLAHMGHRIPIVVALAVLRVNTNLVAGNLLVLLLEVLIMQINAVAPQV